MTDTQEIDDIIDLQHAERDQATTAATASLVAAVLELRAAIGRTPYITTVLTALADVDQVLGKLSEITDVSERWLTINAKVADTSLTHDVDLLLRDVRRDLKGTTAALGAQHRHLHRSIARAWSVISHRPGVVGRETW